MGKMKLMTGRQAWILTVVAFVYCTCWLYLYCTVYALNPSDSLIDTMEEPLKVDTFVACDSTLVDPVYCDCCVYVCDCDTVEVLY
jgi:hypothetical protein|tara:strand:+ start:3485 stop:3739 length:255 start_codon:yes stop_codon:yes gene_type:complete